MRTEVPGDADNGDCGAGIDKSLALERKIESRKRNFSLDLENLIVSISLSTLDYREW